MHSHCFAHHLLFGDVLVAVVVVVCLSSLISLKDDKITKPEEGELPPWVNIVAYRRKQNGSFRLCLDPKDLDETIQRVHHVTPSLKEILPKFIGGTVFSIVDAKLGYWKVVPDKDSSYPTHR